MRQLRFRARFKHCQKDIYDFQCHEYALRNTLNLIERYLEDYKYTWIQRPDGAGHCYQHGELDRYICTRSDIDSLEMMES